MSTSGTSGTSGGSTHIFRSLSSESQKREWSKRLSLRGMRHGGGTAGLATSKEVRKQEVPSFCSSPLHFTIKLRIALPCREMPRCRHRQPVAVASIESSSAAPHR